MRPSSMAGWFNLGGEGLILVAMIRYLPVQKRLHPAYLIGLAGLVERLP